MVAEGVVLALPLPALQPLTAAAGGVLVGTVVLAALALVYLRMGLPSLPKSAAPIPAVRENEQEITEQAAGLS